MTSRMIYTYWTYLALLLRTELNSTIFHIQGSSKCVIHANVCLGACFVYRCLEAIVSDVVALLGCRHRCWLLVIPIPPRFSNQYGRPIHYQIRFFFFVVIRGCMLGYIYIIVLDIERALLQRDTAHSEKHPCQNHYAEICALCCFWRM